VLMRLENNALAGVGEHLGFSDDFLRGTFWCRIEAYRDIFNILYELEVFSQAEKTETKSQVVCWIVKAKEQLEHGLYDAIPEAKPLWQSFLDSVVGSVVPLTLEPNNTTNAFLLNPCNYSVIGEGENRSVEAKYLHDDLVQSCWEVIANEAMMCNVSKMELELKKSGIDPDQATSILEGQKSAIDTSVMGAISAAKELIKNEAVKLDSNDESHLKFDLLHFWKVCTSLKVVQPLTDAVKAILCIPASAAGPERLFSVTGRIISKDRNQFAPETVSSIAKAHSFLRNPPPEFQSWTGKKRQREKDPQYVVISSKQLKELIDVVDYDQEVEKLDAKFERRRTRRRLMQEEWDHVDV